MRKTLVSLTIFLRGFWRIKECVGNICNNTKTFLLCTALYSIRKYNHFSGLMNDGQGMLVGTQWLLLKGN